METTMMENQMEKKMENEMETGIIGSRLEYSIVGILVQRPGSTYIHSGMDISTQHK